MSEAFAGNPSGKKYASGKIVLDADSQTISVTGLGFRPKKVTIQCFRKDTGNISTNTISAYFDGDAGIGYYLYNYSGVNSVPANIISTTSDGFSATAPGSYPFRGYSDWFPIYWTAEAD